jgi:nucleotide-binding universal stress UspA family protein
MFQRILVPLDGSALAEQALPRAARLVRASGGLLMLLQVVSPPIDYAGALPQTPLVTEQIIETGLAEADSYLSMVAKSERLAGIKIVTDDMFGAPVQDILAFARSRRVDLIVMCSHGRTGFKRWTLGSVAHQLIHQSPVPVFVLRAGEPALSRAVTTRPLCTLIALDGSPLAEAVLAPAANLVAGLAAPAQGALHLTQVVKQLAATAEEGFVDELNEEAEERAKKYLAAVQERSQETFKGLKLSITWSVARDSDAAEAIIGMAEHGEKGRGPEDFGTCDLIAMATHGRGGLERLVVGSVTEKVLGATRLPVLIVRPQQVRQM